MSISLNRRLLGASSVVLACFLGATGLVLDNAFRASTESALRDRVQNQLYAVLAASDIDESGSLKIPPDLPDPRFSQLGSGLYAEVVNDREHLVWRSRSMLGIRVAFPKSAGIGKRVQAPIKLRDGTRLLGLVYAVSWDSASGPRQFVYRVAESRTGVETQIRRFRTSLWGWLGGAAVLLLVVQAAVLSWGLKPLRTVAAELRDIESGLQKRLSGNYPKELSLLTGNINALLESAELHLGRYRDSLGNLAHSLKTPLAVIRAAIEDRPEETLPHIVDQQIGVMKQIIDYQLQRAAASGRVQLATPVVVRPVVENVVAAMAKVYAEKSIDYSIDIDPETVFHGDPGDLTEMLGNLLDNASKWSRGQVRITAKKHRRDGVLLEITVEDDGPGISTEARHRVRQRGVRADTVVTGHGLGLSMVTDTIALYQGKLLLESGRLGGLRATLQIPEINA